MQRGHPSRRRTAFFLRSVLSLHTRRIAELSYVYKDHRECSKNTVVHLLKSLESADGRRGINVLWKSKLRLRCRIVNIDILFLTNALWRNCHNTTTIDRTSLKPRTSSKPTQVPPGVDLSNSFLLATFHDSIARGGSCNGYTGGRNRTQQRHWRSTHEFHIYSGSPHAAHRQSTEHHRREFLQGWRGLCSDC